MGRGVWPMLMGAVDWVRKGSYHPAWAVPHVPVRMRTGGAQLSGHVLESGAGHCQPECGGLSHP